MNTSQKGIARGIVYPLIAFTFHAILFALIHSGFFSDAGALALTSWMAYIDHKILPNVSTGV